MSDNICPLCHEVYEGRCKHPVQAQWSAIVARQMDGLLSDFNGGNLQRVTYGSGWVEGGICEPASDG